MKPLKSLLAIVVLLLITATTGPVLAHHKEWHHRGHGAHSHQQYVAPRSGPDVHFSFSIGVPAYVYEPAPYYYYPAPARYYYREPAYYYYENPTWPYGETYSD
jgi:hypothetical protein